MSNPIVLLLAQGAQPAPQLTADINGGATQTFASALDWIWHSVPIDLSAATALIDKGGPVVIILLILSLLASTVVIAKAAQFIGLRIGRDRGLETALGAWLAGDGEGACNRLRGRQRGPAPETILHAMTGLARGQGEERVREDVERVALEKLAGLRSYLRILEATSQLAPLLGLFGTVIGMIAAFQTLQSSGAEADPSALAGGIWVALLTTAVGLAVAIPAAFSLYWFEGRIEREKELIEAGVTSLFTGRLQGASAVDTAAASPDAVIQGVADPAARPVRQGDANAAE